MNVRVLFLPFFFHVLFLKVTESMNYYAISHEAIDNFCASWQLSNLFFFFFLFAPYEKRIINCQECRIFEHCALQLHFLHFFLEPKRSKFQCLRELSMNIGSFSRNLNIKKNSSNVLLHKQLRVIIVC